MKDDKKKLAVVAVMACIIVAIGAFQFLGKGGRAPTPPAKPAAPAAQAADDKTVPNPEFADALPVRNPFAAPPDVAAADKNAAPAKSSAPSTAFAPRPLSGDLPLGPTALEALPPAPGLPPQAVPTTAFTYRLSGLIVGRRPAAVFTDSTGAQRLVQVGGSLDGDARLVGVAKDEATVTFRGKRLHLTLGGTPDASN